MTLKESYDAYLNGDEKALDAWERANALGRNGVLLKQRQDMILDVLERCQEVLAGDPRRQAGLAHDLVEVRHWIREHPVAGDMVDAV